MVKLCRNSPLSNLAEILPSANIAVFKTNSPLVKLCRKSPLGKYCCIQDKFSSGQTLQKISPVKPCRKSPLVKSCGKSLLWSNFAENLPCQTLQKISPRRIFNIIQQTLSNLDENEIYFKRCHKYL